MTGLAKNFVVETVDFAGSVGRLVGEIVRALFVSRIDWADVEGKYRALAPFAKFSGNHLEASIKVIRNFREVRKVSELVGLLR